jgi:AraC-like DNA-binding protein
MKYDHFFFNDPVKWEHIWAYRPLPQRGENFPLLIQNAGYARWRAGAIFARKVSTEFYVEYVCAGNVQLIQDRKQYLVGPKEIYLLRKGSEHQYTAGPAGFVVKRFAQITGTSVDYYLRSLGLWEKEYIRPAQPRIFNNLLKQATTLLTHSPEDNDLQVAIQLSCLAYQLLLELSRTNQPETPPMIAQALTFMHENLHRSLTRQEICAHVGVSAAYFCRIFSEYMGCSPVTYFLEQKFNWTAQMLKTTGLSIKEVSDKAGFESPFYFSAQFKKHFGYSPKRFREHEHWHLRELQSSDYRPC